MERDDPNAVLRVPIGCLFMRNKGDYRYIYLLRLSKESAVQWCEFMFPFPDSLRVMVHSGRGRQGQNGNEPLEGICGGVSRKRTEPNRLSTALPYPTHCQKVGLV